jgi:uncharacterized protein (TIGR03083 family)
MKRAEVIAGLFAEYDAFVELISQLTSEEWQTPTRCEGWEVRDVAGHVTGNVVDSMTGEIGKRTPGEQARAFRDGAPAELAERLREATARVRPFFESLSDDDWAKPSPVPGRDLGNGILTLWYDVFVHADDIRTALGRPSERGPGLEASVHWLAGELERLERGPVTIALDGFGEREIGTGGPVLRGDPMRFVLVATGREDPAEFGADESINVHMSA